MKIALIDPSLFTWPYDNALVLAMQAHGHDARLYTKHLNHNDQCKSLYYVKELFYPGLNKAWAQRLPKLVFLGLKGLLHIIGMIHLLILLWRSKPDAIHFQWLPLPVIDRLFIPLFRQIAPTILTVHDSAPFNNNPTSHLQRLGSIDIMRTPDRVIVHTEHARQKLVAYGLSAGKIVRIAHGMLQTPTFSSKPPTNGADFKKAVTLLLFGKLKPYKGADILIRALAALPASVLEQCRLRIVGKAEMDVRPLIDLADHLNVSQHIDWNSRFVSDDEMATIFSTTDITVMPYRAIDASGVLMVALTMAKPIVASNIGLCVELLENGKHGYLVPPEDHVALANALKTLIENAELRKQMGQAVHHLQASIPTWEQIAEQTVDLYRSVSR